MPTVQSWPALLDQLLIGESLSAQQATALMQGWLSEQIDPVLTGGLLAALRAKGVSGEELAAMAEVLRQACPLPASRPSLALVDTCGTGGDGANTFNISTAVSFVAAACGAHVAKHGNRAASSKAGAADTLGTSESDMGDWVGENHECASRVLPYHSRLSSPPFSESSSHVDLNFQNRHCRGCSRIDGPVAGGAGRRDPGHVLPGRRRV